MEYKPDWNGRLDITHRPANTSRTLVHDKTGNVVSIATNGGLPDMTVELPYGRQRLHGDEVSKWGLELVPHPEPLHPILLFNPQRACVEALHPC